MYTNIFDGRKYGGGAGNNHQQWSQEDEVKGAAVAGEEAGKKDPWGEFPAGKEEVSFSKKLTCEELVKERSQHKGEAGESGVKDVKPINPMMGSTERSTQLSTDNSGLGEETRDSFMELENPKT